MKDWQLKLVIYLGLLNFISFLAIYFLIGGDAPNGKVENGHYYLDQHGTYTEVSHAVFIYSACHAYSALFGLVLVFVAARAWKRRRKLPSK
jgi:hypothetical protein